VRHHGGVVPRCASEGGTVALLLLEVAAHSAFRKGANRKNVADSELRFLAAVDELASVQPLGGNEELLVVLEARLVAEKHLGEWGAAAGVVHDLLHNALDVPVALGIVELAQLLRTAGDEISKKRVEEVS